MILLLRFPVLVSGLLAAVASSHTTGRPEEQALRSAASANLPFFTAFINDINTNLPSYNSFMAANNMELPQPVANYYFHVAQLPQTADLEADVASSFPFTEFRTFITNFPWYETLLQKASASTIYVPEDFMTSSVAPASTGAPSAARSSTNNPPSTTLSATNSSGQLESQNAAAIQKSSATLLLVVLGFLL